MNDLSQMSRCRSVFYVSGVANRASGIRGWRSMSLVLWACVSVFVTGCAQSPDLETSRRFQESEALFAKASEPQEFLRVAALYQEIIDGGFRSGVVFYNQGNAWMQAGQTGRAIASYRQAQRIMPRDPYLQANLKQALGANATRAKVPVFDHVFFWQQSLSYQEKLMISTIFLAIAIALALVRQFGRNPIVARNLCLGACVLTLMMGISVARDWYLIERTVHGVITDDVVARKGGSTTYEPAFTQPLRSGTEFTLLESAPSNWMRIRLSGVNEGWIPERAAVTY